MEEKNVLERILDLEKRVAELEKLVSVSDEEDDEPIVVGSSYIPTKEINTCRIKAVFVIDEDVFNIISDEIEIEEPSLCEQLRSHILKLIKIKLNNINTGLSPDQSNEMSDISCIDIIITSDLVYQYRKDLRPLLANDLRDCLIFSRDVKVSLKIVAE